MDSAVEGFFSALTIMASSKYTEYHYQAEKVPATAILFRNKREQLGGSSFSEKITFIFVSWKTRILRRGEKLLPHVLQEIFGKPGKGNLLKRTLSLPFCHKSITGFLINILSLSKHLKQACKWHRISLHTYSLHHPVLTQRTFLCGGQKETQRVVSEHC